jgi:hypothetical protein
MRGMNTFHEVYGARKIPCDAGHPPSPAGTTSLALPPADISAWSLRVEIALIGRRMLLMRLLDVNSEFHRDFLAPLVARQSAGNREPMQAAGTSPSHRITVNFAGNDEYRH